MKIVYNRLIPFKGFTAINLFGILFVRKGMKVDAIVMEHERIHTAQMCEMLYIPFYLWYGIEWLVRLIQYHNAKKAYYNIGFEREAYFMQLKPYYCDFRSHYAWWWFMRNNVYEEQRKLIKAHLEQNLFDFQQERSLSFLQKKHSGTNMYMPFSGPIMSDLPSIIPNVCSDGVTAVYYGITGEGKEATDEKDNVQ